MGGLYAPVDALLMHKTIFGYASTIFKRCIGWYLSSYFIYTSYSKLHYSCLSHKEILRATSRLYRNFTWVERETTILSILPYQWSLLSGLDVSFRVLLASSEQHLVFVKTHVWKLLFWYFTSVFQHNFSFSGFLLVLI